MRQVVVANGVDCRLLKNAAALITKYLASIHYKVPQFLSHIASVRKGKGKGIWTTFPFQSFPFERYITKCVNCYKISQESSSSNDCRVIGVICRLSCRTIGHLNSERGFVFFLSAMRCRKKWGLLMENNNTFVPTFLLTVCSRKNCGNV